FLRNAENYYLCENFTDMTKKKKKPVFDAPEWSVCHISGCTVACDPGCQTITPYPKSYTREQIKVGMNLTGYCEYLIKVKVKEIGPNYLTLQYSGANHILVTGARLETPRQPLSYAYSEVDIRLE
ncbi:MAG: hypothetical protein IIX59_09005, partial [Alistipes sp.]|nr:hypothetical protein [Alistipes sp.]